MRSKVPQLPKTNYCVLWNPTVHCRMQPANCPNPEPHQSTLSSPTPFPYDTFTFWWGNLTERTRLENLKSREKDNFKTNFQKIWLVHRLGWSASGQGCCECGNEPSGFHRMREIPSLTELLKDCTVKLVSYYHLRQGLPSGLFPSGFLQTSEIHI
jgi:hypothetical protein